MNLKDLYNIDISITGICDDSRYIESTDAFICVKGANYSGYDYIDEVIARGVKVIISEEAVEADIINIVVDDIDQERKKLCDLIYPISHNISLIAITGTDGKTTTATYLYHLLNLEKKAAYIGTNGIWYHKIKLQNINTTPSNLLIRKFIHLFEAEQIDFLVLEATSIGIDSNRIDSLLFDYIIYTNFSHDHLDYHKTKNNYLNTKLSLQQFIKKDGIICTNLDDTYFREIKGENVIYYSLQNNCDIYIKNSSNKELQLIINNQLKSINTNVKETYNLYNLLPCLYIFNGLFSYIPETIIMPTIEGRMEYIDTINNRDIYVDFAHTPNAIKTIALEYPDSCLVIGSAGQRDKSKRKYMGLFATTYAKYVVFTEEDNRDESVLDIMNDLTELVTKDNHTIIQDRQQAIEYAITSNESYKRVIICGKGREEFMYKNNKKIKYSDIEVIKKISKSFK